MRRDPAHPGRNGTEPGRFVRTYRLDAPCMRDPIGTADRGPVIETAPGLAARYSRETHLPHGGVRLRQQILGHRGGLEAGGAIIHNTVTAQTDIVLIGGQGSGRGGGTYGRRSGGHWSSGRGRGVTLKMRGFLCRSQRSICDTVNNMPRPAAKVRSAPERMRSSRAPVIAKVTMYAWGSGL